MHWLIIHLTHKIKVIVLCSGNASICAWSNSSIGTLIKEYKRLKPMFKSEQGVNKKCWDIISKALKSQGLHFSGDQCLSKFRQLQQTYRKFKKHQEETGELKPWLFLKVNIMTY